jgi:uncharacterized protein (UPF0210 family)
MLRSAHFSRTFCFRVTIAVSLLWLLAVTVRAQGAPPAAAKPVVRAVTAFVNLDRAEYQAQIADAFKTLRLAQTILESRGYVVEGLRIATQPFPEYSRDLPAGQTLAFFQQLDALAAKDHLQISIGPAMYHLRDSESEAEMLGNILLNTKNLSGSVMVADRDGLHNNAARAAASIMRKLSLGTPNSQGSMRFAALAMIAPLTPSFPAAYVDGFGHQFAFALESADVVARAVNSSPDNATAKQRITDLLAGEAYDLDGYAGRVDSETGWAYAGVDLSPASLQDASIGDALEGLSGHQAGSKEAVAAASVIASAIRGVSLRQIGFGGVPLTILEDRRLAQRWSEGRISIDTLMDYASAGGTGLDAVPLPGDTTNSQLEVIIVNAASFAYRSRKPLIIRLLPVAGKTAGDRTEFDDPGLVNVTLQPYRFSTTPAPTAP